MNYTRIKGLSDTRRLPRAGKIRLGVKKVSGSGKEFPAEVDFFVCPEEVRAIYGASPKEIDIQLPVEDPTIFFPQAYKWYGSDQGLKCKGDGETALRRYNLLTEEDKKAAGAREDDDLIEISCPCDLLESGKCGPKGILMVLLPKVTLNGVYQIDTGSVLNIVELNSKIDLIGTLVSRAGGSICDRPLKLARIPQEVTYTDPKTKRQTKSTHALLKLTFDDADIYRMRRRELTSAPTTAVLAAPIEDGPDPSACPVLQENGDVVDIESGEVLKANPTPPGGDGDNVSNEALLKELRACIDASKIDRDHFVRWLGEKCEWLTPHQDGFHLRDLFPQHIRAVLDNWAKVLDGFEPWEQETFPQEEPEPETTDFPWDNTPPQKGIPAENMSAATTEDQVVDIEPEPAGQVECEF